MSEKKKNQPESSLRLAPVSAQQRVMIRFNGQEVEARFGEAITSALLATGYRTLRRSHSGSPRGMLCGMGVCYECLVKVDGQPFVKACQTYVKPGMQVEMEGL
jgi:predicted molibdopterin-dependent oxidoreductase YjgC